MCSLSKQNASFVTAGTFSRLSIICSKLIIFIKTQQEYKCAPCTNIDASLFKMFLLAFLICLPCSISNLLFVFSTIYFFRIFQHTTPAWTQNLKNSQKMIKNIGGESKTGKQKQEKLSIWASGENSGFVLTLWKYFVTSLIWMNLIFREHKFASKAFQCLLALCWKSGKVKSQELLQR